MASTTKLHTYEELAKHKDRDDCWLLIEGKVYNVTSFLEEHPGGDEVLLAVTAKDATDDFLDVGHSDSAREMMEKYYVGEIDSSTVPAKPSVKFNPPQRAQKADDSGFMIKILQFLVPLLILGLAFGFRNFLKKD